MLEKGLVAYLENHAGLNALIAGRVYPLRLKQNATLPAVVYQRITTAPTYSQEGDSHLDEIQMQFACWGSTLLTVKQIAEELRVALSGFAGTMGTETVGGSFLINQHSDDDPDTGLSREIVEFSMWHNS